MATDVMRSKEICEKWMEAMFAARKTWEAVKEQVENKNKAYAEAKREYMEWKGSLERENELIDILHFQKNELVSMMKRCERVYEQFMRVKQTYARAHEELIACL